MSSDSDNVIVDVPQTMNPLSDVEFNTLKNVVDPSSTLGTDVFMQCKQYVHDRSFAN